MGSFSRKVARSKARDLGLLQTKGQQRKIATRAKRMWCPECKLVCDAQDAVKWSEWTALSGRKTRTLRCARCNTQVEGRDLSELPEGTPEKGRWFRPGPGGWGAQAEILRRVAEKEHEEAKRDETGADSSGEAGGEAGPGLAEGEGMESG